LNVHCIYDDYLHALEYVREMDDVVHATLVSRHLDEYLNKNWLRVGGYYDGDTLEDGFGFVADVDYTVDLAAGVYRYPNPFWPGATIVKPLKDITYYSFCVDQFLDDLAALIGIEKRPKKTEIITAYLWELGEVKVGGTNQCVRVFVARHEHDLPYAQIRSWLDDEINPGQSVVLVHKPVPSDAVGEHIVRCLSDLVDVESSQSMFRLDKLQRVLNRYPRPVVAEPEYLNGRQLKLKHFKDEMTLPAALVRIVNQAWGTQGKTAPVVTWAEVNAQAKTGYVSFDNAFGSKQDREKVFDLVSRGKYRLRRAKG